MAQSKLNLGERRRLVSIIAGLYEFRDGGAQGRRVLIEMAGLDTVLANVQLDGPALTVAGAVVNLIERYGPLQQESAFDALGALLSYVVTLGDLPQEEARFLAGLIVKYTLVKQLDLM